MTYTTRDRDRGRAAVTAVTAAVTAGSMTSMGWLAGAAAADHARDEAKRTAALQQQQAAYERALARQSRRVVLRERPSSTRVSVRYVGSVSSSNPVGGGSIASTATSSSSGGSGSSSGPGAGGSSGAGPSAPPLPAPPTSSGS